MSNIRGVAVSRLNEYCQQKQLPPPDYSTVTINGPSHAPVFTMKVIVDEREFVASGTTKKIAKFKCAAKAVDEIDVDQYLKNQLKIHKYRVCNISVEGHDAPLEALWNEDDIKEKEIVLVLKRSNELEEHELKTIKLRVSK